MSEVKHTADNEQRYRMALEAIIATVNKASTRDTANTTWQCREIAMYALSSFKGAAWKL